MDWLTDDADDEGEHFTAGAMVNYQLASRGLTVADLGVRPLVIATFQSFIYAHLARLMAAQPNDQWAKVKPLPFAAGRYRDVDVSLIQLPVGASAAVLELESLAICGAESLIAVGAAGSLVERAPIGAAVLPTSAVREEGTSYHYRPADVPALPSADVLVALRDACGRNRLDVCEGPVWTTDAPYREFTSKVRRMAAAGVVAVDMEASALFVAGEMRGLRVGSLFVISDELFLPWRPAFRDPGYRSAAATVARSALDALVSLPDS